MKYLKEKFPTLSSVLDRLRIREQGAALVEELVTVAVIGLGLSILVSMIATGVIGVRTIDDQVTAEYLARSQLELIKDSPYQADPVSSPYPSPPPQTGYAVTLNIRYWNAGSSSFTTAQRNDGLQEITVIVTEDGNQLASLTGYKTDR